MIALRRDVHIGVNRNQASFDLSAQTPLENIAKNARLLRDTGVHRRKIQKLANKAIKHARKLELMD